MEPPIYLPTAWNITSTLQTCWSLGAPPAPSGGGKTMDDVLNMDNVISMDTLDET